MILSAIAEDIIILKWHSPFKQKGDFAAAPRHYFIRLSYADNKFFRICRALKRFPAVTASAALPSSACRYHRLS